MRARKTMRVSLTGRVHLCGEDDAKSVGEISRRFARFRFVRSPRAIPGRPALAWARRMNESPNLAKNEESGARLDHFSRPDEKMVRRGPVRGDEWRCSNTRFGTSAPDFSMKMWSTNS
jgi:hypothetical protein